MSYEREEIDDSSTPTGVYPAPSSPEPLHWRRDKSKTPGMTYIDDDGREVTVDPGSEWFWDESGPWPQWQIRQKAVAGPTGTTQTTTTTPGTATGTGTVTGTATGFSGRSYDSSGFAWPTYDAPAYLDPGQFDPGQPFSFEDFTYQDFSAPTAETMLNEPGFQFRLDQGRKALEASAAGRGTLRSGGTLKDILQYGQNFASQEYGNVYNRALQEYDTNRGNAFGNYQSRRQNAWDTWNTGYGGRKDAYTFLSDNYNRQNAFNQNNAQFGFNARQQQSQAEFDDLFRRWAKEGDWIVDSGNS